jgi:hypothetical protein
MGKFLIKASQSLETNDSKMEHTNVENFIESIQINEQKSAFSQLSPLSFKDQISIKHSNISSSFKIEDILNSNQNNRNFNNDHTKNSQFYKNCLDNDLILTEMEHQLSSRDKGYFLKENFDEINSKNNPKINSNKKLNEKNSSTYFSSSSSSSSSYCSPIQSVYPSYSLHQNSSESFIINPTDYLAKNLTYFNNPFAALTNGQFNANFHKSIESNIYDPLMNQMTPLLIKTHEQNKNYLAMEDLIKTTLSSKILNKEYDDRNLDPENETKKKIVIIDEIAKKIDAFSEFSANSKNQTNSTKNIEKNHLKKSKKNSDKPKQKEKSMRFTKKREEGNEEEDEDYNREGFICNCSDLACSKYFKIYRKRRTFCDCEGKLLVLKGLIQYLNNWV